VEPAATSADASSKLPISFFITHLFLDSIN
jgi:hypothetical protein